MSWLSCCVECLSHQPLCSHFTGSCAEGLCSLPCDRLASFQEHAYGSDSYAVQFRCPFRCKAAVLYAAVYMAESRSGVSLAS